MSKEKADKNIQEALNYLRLDFHNLGIVISQYHPLEVLKMAVWEERRIARTKGRDPLSSATGRLLPVLLQSIVQSTSYDVSNGISSNRNIKEKDWQRIKTLTDDVAKRLIRCIDSYTVLAVRSGKISDDNAAKYRDLLFIEAFPPAEDIERVERISYMTFAAMQGAESVIKEKYGTTPEVLINELYKIIKRGLEGIDRLSEEATQYKTEVETLMAQKRASDPTRIISDEDLVREIIRENGWESRVSRLAGERDDFDLFRPEFAANLPSIAYETLSVAPGTIDIDEMMLKGLWPATIYPFIRFGSMYFSFVSQHIQSYGLRILQETAGLCLRYTEATVEALKLLFRESDEVDVYTFDGNKVDVSILSSLIEVNAFTSPELFQSRVLRRREECHKKPSIGHKALIVEPDDFEELRSVEENTFASSAYYILKAARYPELKKKFYKTIFGQLEMPEPSEYDSIIDPDEIEKEEGPDDDVLDDDITDEYEYESEDEDEKDRKIEEKEKLLEESIPEDSIDYERSAELEKLAEQYELTDDIIERDRKNEAEADEYEKELDDDDFVYDEENDDVTDDDVDPEAEKIYDEAEKVDEYSDENYTDPDQLTFFDELFGDDDIKEADRMADEEFAEEDEEEFKKSEEEAEEFAATDEEKLPNSCVEVASEATESDEPIADEADDSSSPDDGEIPESTEDENGTSLCDDEDSSGHEAEPAESEESESHEPDAAGNDDLQSKEATVPDDPVMPAAEEEKAEEPSEACSEAEDDEGEEPAENETETTESLIDKGLVKPVELAGGGRVFVMTENTNVPLQEEDDGSAESDKARKVASLPGILHDIATRLDDGSVFMDFLEEADDEMRDYLGKVIKSSWEKQRIDGKDKMFSIFDYSISVIISASKVNDSLRREALLNNAGAVMYSRHAEKWTALILSISDDYGIVDAYEKNIAPDSFSASNWKICRVIGEQLIARGNGR